MPMIDMPLDELKQYKGTSSCPMNSQLATLKQK